MNKLRKLLKKFWVWTILVLIVGSVISFFFNTTWALALTAVIMVLSRIWIDGDEK